MLRYSPHLRREVRVFLKAAAGEMRLDVLPAPLKDS
jgi:hypothetical protein